MTEKHDKQAPIIGDRTAEVATLLTEMAELAVDKRAIGVIVLMVLPGAQECPLHIEAAPCISVRTVAHVCKQAADAALAGKTQVKFLAVSGQEEG